MRIWVLPECSRGGARRLRLAVRVVERLNDKNPLVEFSDDEGSAYVIAPCPDSELLVLHYDRQAV